LLFPPVCYHCQVVMEDNKSLFCQVCLERLNYALKGPYVKAPQKLGIFNLQDIGRTLYREMKKYHFIDLGASFILVMLVQQKAKFPLRLIVHEEGVFSHVMHHMGRSLSDLGQNEGLFVYKSPFQGLFKPVIQEKRVLHIYLSLSKEALIRMPLKGHENCCSLFIRD